ncbi:hypothetical protein ACS0TY_023061 [Phlomoides rotata]
MAFPNINIKTLIPFLVLSSILFVPKGTDATVSQIVINLFNELPRNSIPMVHHCYNKLRGGKDLGYLRLNAGQRFSWSFKSDDAKPLVYTCEFNWITKADMINVFISNWRDHHIYNYVIKEDGIYVNYDTDKYQENLRKISGSW